MGKPSDGNGLVNISNSAKTLRGLGVQHQSGAASADGRYSSQLIVFLTGKTSQLPGFQRDRLIRSWWNVMHSWSMWYIMFAVSMKPRGDERSIRTITWDRSLPRSYLKYLPSDNAFKLLIQICCSLSLRNKRSCCCTICGP